MDDRVQQHGSIELGGLEGDLSEVTLVESCVGHEASCSFDLDVADVDTDDVMTGGREIATFQACSRFGPCRS